VAGVGCGAGADAFGGGVAQPETVIAIDNIKLPAIPFVIPIFVRSAATRVIQHSILIVR
jgi:hypothetical protein